LRRQGRTDDKLSNGLNVKRHTWKDNGETSASPYSVFD
jgi:hypothetical protein